MNGFYQYRDLKGVTYAPPAELVVVEQQRTQQDDLLDLIFSTDPVTHLPSGALSMYLSDKTSDEVRTYIEKTLLADIPTENYSSQELYNALLDADGSMIADIAPRRFESVEDYESRVMASIEKAKSDNIEKARIESLNQKLQESLK